MQFLPRTASARMAGKSNREVFAMTQLYLQRFEYRAAAKSEFDAAWATALQTFARSGNWGGAESGVRHIKTYGTAWGGDVLIEVDDAEAFGRDQIYQGMNEGQRVEVLFGPAFESAGLVRCT